MKPSKAILKGFAMVNGKKCTRKYSRFDKKGKIIAVCAIGAMNLGRSGRTSWSDLELKTINAFEAATGFSIARANDRGMSIPDIAGILAAEGY